MKRTIVDFVARIKKHFSMHTVHEYVPRVLVTVIISELRERGLSADDINERLFEYGVFAGSRALAEMASPREASFLAGEGTTADLASVMKIYGETAWYIFTGSRGSMNVEVIDPGIIHGTLTPLEKNFFDIEAGEVNPYYIAAGSYESATLMFFQLIGIEKRWASVWRPRDRGLEGYYVRRDIEWVDKIREQNPEFFAKIGVEKSDRLLREYVGISLLD